MAHDMGSSVALELLERTSLTVTQLTLLNGSIWLEHYRPLLTQRLLLHALTGPLISRLRLIGYRAFARQFGSVFATPPPAREIEAFWPRAARAGERVDGRARPASGAAFDHLGSARSGGAARDRRRGDAAPA
jgi:hypothetical protein